jgi:plastocyanin
MGQQRRVLGLVTAVMLVAGCGGGGGHGSHSSADRVVNVTMRDIAFDPASVEVKAGETVRFVFHNEGQIRHDAFIGDEAAQAEH